MNTADTIKRCNELSRFWLPRAAKFEEWYKLIQMVDELKTDKMESFVGNDPQSNFKLLRHLLSQKIPHRVPQELVTVDNVTAASDISTLFDSIWSDVESRHRRRGKQSWIWDLAGFTLSTGWYAAFATMSQDGTRGIAEILNPATVFPWWDDDLVECARIETLSPGSIERMAIRNNWGSVGYRTNQRMYDYWRLDTSGNVYNTIIIGTKSVKPEAIEPRLNRIPIFTAPVGGLPDTGIITKDVERWKAEIGQSCVATNENIYRAWNKWWSLTLQLLRDTVQARIKEKSRSGKPIVKPEDVFKRGAIFRMTPDEDVEFMQPPAIPVELRSTQLDMEAMLQRGGPSWSMFGAVAGQMTAYVMSQIAASTNQVAKPYHQGIIDCVTDIDNLFLEQIKTHSYKPQGLELPKDFPPSFRLTAEYEIRIPGDLIQRATVARMLDPDFRVSYSRVMEELFPEVKNPMKEKALVRADAAERDPVNAAIALIEALKQQADLLAKANDSEGAALYMKAAAGVEQKLGLLEEENQVAQAQLTAAPARKLIGNRTEALPPEGTVSAPIA